MYVCIFAYVSVRTNYHHQTIDIISADIAEAVVSLFISTHKQPFLVPRYK